MADICNLPSRGVSEAEMRLAQDPLDSVLWAYTWGKPGPLAREPERTVCWLAAESGMRGGELCGLQFSDFDLERGLVRGNRNVSRGKIQSTKRHRSQTASRRIGQQHGISRD